MITSKEEFNKALPLQASVLWRYYRPATSLYYNSMIVASRTTLTSKTSTCGLDEMHVGDSQKWYK